MFVMPIVNIVNMFCNLLYGHIIIDAYYLKCRPLPASLSYCFRWQTEWMQIRLDKIFGLGLNPYCLVRLDVPEDGPRGARGN